MEIPKLDDSFPELPPEPTGFLDPCFPLFSIRVIDAQKEAGKAIGRWLTPEELEIVQNNLYENLSTTDVLAWALEEVLANSDPRKKKKKKIF